MTNSHLSKEHFENRARRALFAAGLCALVLLALAVRGILIDAYENASSTFFPNAERAFAYGRYHFDAAALVAYDLNRAAYFFQKAAQLDPQTPYVYHELARIAFLRGDFDQALALIDLQIEMHGDSEPNSYYVRGLIEGYKGDYASAANDYAYFLKFDPKDWAAINDDAWVLLKAKRFQEAANMTARGLALEPDNSWLLNSRATALYELGDYKGALATAQKAEVAVSGLTNAQWSHAYPGNDPSIAAQGLASFRQAVADNVHTIKLALASSTVQL